MCELQHDNHRTDPLADAANRPQDIDTAADGTRRSECSNSPAFASWLLQYRYRLAKVLEGKTD